MDTTENPDFPSQITRKITICTPQYTSLISWRFADLDLGGNAGLAAGNGNVAPGGSDWYSRPRLCGAGKKRGEWSA